MSGVPNKKYRAIIIVIMQMTNVVIHIYIDIGIESKIVKSKCQEKVQILQVCFNIWINKCLSGVSEKSIAQSNFK